MSFISEISKMLVTFRRPEGLVGAGPGRSKTVDALVFLFGVMVALGMVYLIGKYIANSF